jgi:EmrB/QacA subfamily drug resistance transporter
VALLLDFCGTGCLDESEAMISTAGELNEPVATSRRLILWLVLLAQFVVVLDGTIVAVALPAIESSLHFANQLSLQWVINAYALLFGGFLLLGGRAGDLYGRRTLFVTGLALFTAASLANGLAQSTETLIAGRAVQGLAGALVTPAALAIIIATFTVTTERTKALGIFASVSAGGAAAGFLLGGILTDALSWRWIFFVNVPIGAAGVLLALRYVPNSRASDGETRAIDIPGAITVTGGVGLLVYAIVKAQEWGWGSTRFALTAAGAALLLLAFVAVELRSRAPLIRLGVFRSRSLSAANAVMFLFVAGLFSTLFFPTLYMQQVLGYSPIKTGLAYLPWPIALAAASTLGQRLIPRLGARPMLVVGLTVVAAGLFLLSRIPDGGSYAADILPGFLLSAAGSGLTYATLYLLATAGVRNEEAGLASGIISTSQQLGAAVGLAALASVAASRTSSLLGVGSSPVDRTHALVAGFQRGLLVASMLALAAAAVAILTVRRDDLEQVPEEAAAELVGPETEPADKPAVPVNGARGEILIAFDGSENARHAIRVAARELGGGRAAVLHVWEPLLGVAPPVASPTLAAGAGGAQIEGEAERAGATAEEGAALARAAGFDAEAHSLRTDGSIGAAIVDYADRHPTRLVVIGTRGLSGVRSALTGSVTQHVTQHVHVPVLAVTPEGPHAVETSLGVRTNRLGQTKEEHQ